MHAAIERMSMWILAASWQASVVALAVLAVRALLGKWLPARWQHALWWLVVLRLIVPVSITTPFSLFHWVPSDPLKCEAGQGLRNRPFAAHDRLAIESRIDPEAGRESPWSIEWQAAGGNGVRIRPVQEKTNQDLRVGGFRIWWPWAWAIGASFFGVRLLKAARRLHQQLGMLLPETTSQILNLVSDCQRALGLKGKRVVVFRSTDGCGPALAGIWRPRLLLPDGLTSLLATEELRLVVVHELAHLKRRDVLTNWLLSIVEIVHWFNPVVCLAFNRMRDDAELACDAMVLSRTSRGRQKAYGDILLKLVEALSPQGQLAGTAGMLAQSHLLKRRIRMVANFRPSSMAAQFGAATLLIAMAAIALTQPAHSDESAAAATKQERKPVPAVPPSPTQGHANPSAVAPAPGVEALYNLTHRPPPPAPASPEVLTYVVECRFTAKGAAAGDAPLFAPTIKVGEGTAARIKDVTQTPFVTAVKRQGAKEVPTIIVLEEGLDIEITVHRDRDGFATLDATIRNSEIAEVNTKRERYSPRLETRITRAIECLSLGDEMTVELEGPGGRRVVQFAVTLPGMKRHWEDHEAHSPRPEVKDPAPRGYYDPNNEK